MQIACKAYKAPKSSPFQASVDFAARPQLNWHSLSASVSANMRKFPLSEIVELYVDRQMTMKQVADHLGVAPQAVSYRLKSAGISARERSVRKPRNYEKALLEKLYVVGPAHRKADRGSIKFNAR
jgi:transposase-like protein